MNKFFIFLTILILWVTFAESSLMIKRCDQLYKKLEYLPFAPQVDESIFIRIKLLDRYIKLGCWRVEKKLIKQSKQEEHVDTLFTSISQLEFYHFNITAFTITEVFPPFQSSFPHCMKIIQNSTLWLNDLKD